MTIPEPRFYLKDKNSKDATLLVMQAKYNGHRVYLSAVEKIGVGSYLLVPGGWRHTSGAGSEGCTIFQEQSAKFDMMAVKGRGKK